jgi:methylated-DNA-[protein]-cysteine S-methyltransferase
MNTTWTIYESPVGPLTVVGGPRGLTQLHFPGHAGPMDEQRHDEQRHDPHSLADAVAQLEQYFAGRRRSFELDLDLQGTPFQQSVWAQLAAIPYGETRAYGELARAIGRPDRVRAVGAAVGRTPVPIIVPCHRAVGANGALTGYLGGLALKRTLLDLEASVSGRRPLPEVLAGRQLSLTSCPNRDTRRPLKMSGSVRRV